MIGHQKLTHDQRLMKPLFLVPQKWQVENAAKLDAELSFVLHREAAQGNAVSEVERVRLVKRGESPTNPKHERLARNSAIDGQVNSYLARKRNQFLEDVHTCPEPISLASRKTYSMNEYIQAQANNPQNAISASSDVAVKLYAQQWSGKFRFGLETGALGASVAPPETSGERKTDELTKNATRQILESGAYLSSCRGGYTTFLTLTFDDEAREKLENGETTIGKEVSRFFDGAQKIYQRGMQVDFYQDENKDFIDYDEPKKLQFSLPMICPELVFPRLPDGSLKEVPTLEECEKYNFRKHIECDYLENDAVYGQQIKGAPLDYMWVAESPINEHGELNPHVHVLMRWRVDKKHFRAWAGRLESLWGHGFAKLERIHTPEAASNYLLKAVGYLTKGSSQEQGTIKGNRYNISQSARAPKWECIAEFFADNFIAILGELREKLQRKKAKINAHRLACNQYQEQNKAKFQKLSNIDKKSPSEKRQAYIAGLKNNLLIGDVAIKNSQKAIGELPYINDFAIGNMNKEQADNFINWAMRERFWNAGIDNQSDLKMTQLKKDTIENIKSLRSHLRGSEHILLTNELTWQWAKNDSRFELIDDRENVMFDAQGNQWELVT